MEETKVIRGYVTKIIYRNPANAYTVFRVYPDQEIGSYIRARDDTEEEKCITCTGFPMAIREGEPCRVTGHSVSHPVYGEQFQADEYAAEVPRDRSAIYFYLASGALKGVGKAMADRIVEHFGEKTLEIFLREPERLTEVKGIGDSTARRLAQAFSEAEAERDVMLFLAGYEIIGSTARKIYDRFGDSAFTVVKDHPYRLVSEIRGIGFAKADAIAMRAGTPADSDERITCGITWCLQEAWENGSTCMEREKLLDRSLQLLGISDREHVSVLLDNALVDGRLIRKANGEKDCIYLKYTFYQEQSLAMGLYALAEAEPEHADFGVIPGVVEDLKKKQGIELDPLQYEAVEASVSQSVLLLIGGPGTGKTTTIRAIIECAVAQSLDVKLAAPTGRAAKRMQEATGYSAVTIHRLLGGGQAGEGVFRYGKEEPLPCDMVIIDEMSMVDEPLMQALVSALLPGTRLILVGDDHQLPSVGPGSVLKDLEESGLFRVIALRRIFRQAMESTIVLNAHRILDGEPMALDNKNRDFFFLERSDVQVMYKHMVELIRDRLPSYVGCSFSEIQVLTPTKKGPLGTVRLNEVLQSVLNPPRPGKREKQIESVLFREGDKVMQTVNDYEVPWTKEVVGKLAPEEGQGIFNGEFGTIEAIDEAGAFLRIRFDEGRISEYPFEKADSLDLAWAITVHKSQGSEYPAVILPILSGPPILFYRRLLYTAVTRARKTCVILGSRQLLTEMAANEREDLRLTGLQERLQEVKTGRQRGLMEMDDLFVRGEGGAQDGAYDFAPGEEIDEEFPW